MIVPRPQRDLFVLDSPLLADVRGERSLMAFPFFALSKGKWTRPLSYDNGTVSIEIVPTAKGAATIYDKEIVLYIASLMIARLEAGEEVNQEFHFTAHDLFCVTGNNPSARSYGRLSQALERLQGTQIKTNIEAGGEGEEGYFSWLSEAKLYYTRSKDAGGDTRRLKAIRVRLCDWLYRAILHDGQILDYASGYFQLGPVERRLYEIARSSCSDGPCEMELDELRRQLGYQNSLPHFRHALKAIVEADAIPDYRLVLIGATNAPPSGTKGPRTPGYTQVRIEPRLPEIEQDDAGESGAEVTAEAPDSASDE
ncbi:replication initiator protein A [Sphingomonas sp. Leaf25]|uniref:replication initiator protein A n=1 Tax=Sphingomonas sp. Leaf25 TaxID=1735692 RepID=UPI0006F3BC36|nr:replication initiator protein A [Sphingomonas sp. Leaf25]KQN00002.1 RepA family protein [Sphingomonas sp. Leaf25]